MSISQQAQSTAVSVVWNVRWLHFCRYLDTKSEEFSVLLPQDSSGLGSWEARWRLELRSLGDRTLVFLKNMNWDTSTEDPTMISWGFTLRSQKESASATRDPSASDAVILRPGQRLKKELCSSSSLESYVFDESLFIEVQLEVFACQQFSTNILKEVFCVSNPSVSSDEVFLSEGADSLKGSSYVYSDPFDAPNNSSNLNLAEVSKFKFPLPGHLNQASPFYPEVGLPKAWNMPPSTLSSRTSTASWEESSDLHKKSRTRSLSFADMEDNNSGTWPRGYTSKYRDGCGMESSKPRGDPHSFKYSTDVSEALSPCGSGGRIFSASSAVIHSLYCGSTSLSSYRHRLLEVVARSDRQALADVCAAQDCLDKLGVDSCLEALRLVDSLLPKSKIRLKLLAFIRDHLEEVVLTEQWARFVEKSPHLVKDLVLSMKQTAL